MSNEQKSVTIAETTTTKSNQGTGGPPAGKRRRSAPVSDLSPTPVLKSEEGHSRPQRSCQSSLPTIGDNESSDHAKSTPMSPTSNSNAAATVTSPEDDPEDIERRKKMVSFQHCCPV